MDPQYLVQYNYSSFKPKCERRDVIKFELGYMNTHVLLCFTPHGFELCVIVVAMTIT